MGDNEFQALVIDSLKRLEGEVGELREDQKATRQDVAKLKSFKVQVVAWAAGAATVVGFSPDLVQKFLGH